jgi:putative component of membrane protein insertase Oxa1/YidC/SpoIIIJ protein YidD
MPGTLATAALRGVHRYQHSALRHRTSGCCRFTPSCSAYAVQALERRRLPMALLLIVWRLLRCTPLTPAGTFDPVTRARPRAVARACAVLALSGFTTLLVAGTADAVGTEGVHRQTVPGAMAGGCKGFVGGVAVESLDKDHPLQVYKSQRIVVTGVAPLGLAAGGSLTSTTTADIYFIKDLAKVSVDDTSTGTNFQQSTNVDRWLKYGSGIYQVDVRSVAAGGWDCSATFYVELHGSKLAAELAVAVGALGTIGMMASVGGGKPAPSFADLETNSEGIYDPGISPEQLDKREAMDKTEKDVTMNMLNLGLMGCLVALLMGILSIGGPFEAAAVPATAGGGSGGTRRVWVKGHPVLGFFSGLVAGLGITVALQQFGVYPLTIVNAIVAPLLVAVIGAVRGWRGTAWKVPVRG